MNPDELDLLQQYYQLGEENFDIGDDKETWPKYGLPNYREVVIRQNQIFRRLRAIRKEMDLRKGKRPK